MSDATRTKEEQDNFAEILFEELHSDPATHGNRVAHPGYMFRCAMCGKRARDRYGNTPIDRGFDESCMLHSTLVEQS